LISATTERPWENKALKMLPGRLVTDSVAIGPVTHHTCEILNHYRLITTMTGNAMRSLLTILLISIALTASGQGIAAQREASATERSAPPALSAMQSNGLTLSQAVEQVRRQYNGRIVSAETQVNGNRETHVIKVLTEDGKVKTVRVAGKRRA
jgi:hypothetical protein